MALRTLSQISLPKNIEILPREGGCDGMTLKFHSSCSFVYIRLLRGSRPLSQNHLIPTLKIVKSFVCIHIYYVRY